MWLAFLDGKLDQLTVPGEFASSRCPTGRLAPYWRKTRHPRHVTVDAGGRRTMYFNMEHPLVGGYSPRRSRCAARSRLA